MCSSDLAEEQVCRVRGLLGDSGDELVWREGHGGALEVLEDSADDIVSHVAAQPVEGWISFVEKLVGIDRDFIVLPGDKVRARKEDAASPLLNEIESCRHSDLNAGGLAGGGIEHGWVGRDGIDAAMQHSIRLAWVADNTETGSGEELAAYLLREYVNQLVAGGEGGECRDGNSLNALGHQVRPATYVIAA